MEWTNTIDKRNMVLNLQAAMIGSQGQQQHSNAPNLQQKPRVRARRGQATDPHGLTALPNVYLFFFFSSSFPHYSSSPSSLIQQPSQNTDKAPMLDEIIDYVRFLQLQVKVLSLSRLRGAAAAAPLMVDISSQQGGECLKHQSGASINRNKNESLKTAERRVAKLMEEDMGSAMQYLQGKGLCLMPISLAAAISSPSSLFASASAAEGPSSPSSLYKPTPPPAASTSKEDNVSVSMTCFFFLILSSQIHFSFLLH
ncbi:PREDICTED: transcription factor bHLH82 [Tarenaya hassleriana]|uniref:transcription factor bHLH82 n=1 Tax=Tarenaya hassleriana TaxID=28532 RepID=UPI00053C3673|nr:PREDICTED: transcription factor bHLH82 [Tarenaya hassleriana]